MLQDKRRYFIELHLDGREDIPRRHEAGIRRAQAEQFIGQISDWLHQEETLESKVSSIAITAMGQVLITCDQEVISRLRENEGLNIAAIRSGTPLTESIQRISGW